MSPCSRCGRPIKRNYKTARKCLPCLGASVRSPQSAVIDAKSGHLYVCEFDSGWVKVGQSSVIEKRIYQHCWQNPKLTVTKLTTYPCENKLYPRESKMIQAINETHCYGVGREWFQPNQATLKKIKAAALSASKLSVDLL